MIKTIVEIDRQARLRTLETQTYREKALEQLACQKNELEKQDKQRIEDTVNKYNDKLQKKLQQQLIDIENDEKLAADALDEAFESKHEAWSDELVSRVIGG